MIKKLPLSLVVVAKDEENAIERCLRSVPFADECLVVVDEKSSDKTADQAKALGAKVLIEKWRGFGPQKRWAVEQARNPWILSLDADEALSPELQNEISERFQSLKPNIGYSLPRRSFHLGRWIRFGGWYPDAQLRLFHRDHSQWLDAGIHERVEAPSVEVLRGDLLHWVFDDVSDQVRTNDRYSSLQAKALFEKGKRFSLWKLVTKPPVKFLETYLWKRGFLDGMAGFIISVSAAYSVFLKFAKLWELQRSQEKK